MPKMGRPPTPIDWNAFDSLCQMHCTLKEIAFFFKCSEDTIQRQVKKHKKKTFAVYFSEASVGGRLALRRSIWRNALEENDGASQRFLAQQTEDRGGLGMSKHIVSENYDGAGEYERIMGIVTDHERAKAEED